MTQTSTDHRRAFWGGAQRHLEEAVRPRPAYAFARDTPSVRAEQKP